jgi:NADH:ubiquinone oxidoreductase subunit F (NADH-binding)
VTNYVVAPAGFQSDVAVVLGPRLLSGIGNGPGLSKHRRTWPEPRVLRGRQLLDLLHHAEIQGRGGAGFPFARKFQTALESGKRRAVVVNAAEGEPGSAKDSALILTTPHLILDGAEIVARALNVKTIHTMVPSERPAVRPALERALDERSTEIGYEVYETEGTFLSGQSHAVTEALEGRANLPVTSWQPQAVKGLRGRPTVLSNAETFAQVAVLVAMGPQRYAAEGTRDEPGTTLLTIAGDGPGGVVVEVPLGTPLAEVLQLCGYPTDVTVLMGGYFGAWLPPDEVAVRQLSRADMNAAGSSLGAGIILPLDRDACPVVLTARIVEYLAGQSARRCGPCKHGLPALAEAVALLADRGVATATRRINQVADLVNGRGSCAHPDGTAKLVRSMLRAFPDEVIAHEHQQCRAAAGMTAR